jgi:hypothetical protein
MRSIYTLTITFFLLSACSSSQVTVTSTAALPPTNTPLPTPTGTPALSATPTATYTPTAVATLTPEQQLALDAARFGITAEMISGPDAIYKLGYDKDGKIELRDKTNKLIYWDGKWSSKVIMPLVAAAGDCRESSYTKDKYATQKWLNYMVPYGKLIIKAFPSLSGPYVYIDGSNNCWGAWRGDSNFDRTQDKLLAWITKDGKVGSADIFPAELHK